MGDLCQLGEMPGTSRRIERARKEKGLQEKHSKRGGKQVTQCDICGRTTDGGTSYCTYHKVAHDKVQEAFKVWEIALEITWDDYLTRIFDEDGMGKWAKEVVEHLMQQNDSSK